MNEGWILMGLTPEQSAQLRDLCGHHRMNASQLAAHLLASAHRATFARGADAVVARPEFDDEPTQPGTPTSKSSQNMQAVKGHER